MIYIISPNYLVANVLKESQVRDDKYFNFEVKVLKQKGIDKFLLRHRVTMKSLCKYFTDLTQSINDISYIEISSEK